MTDYFFRTSDLSVGYDNKVLIENINIDIRAGEIVTLIGPNGAGKSTILKSITKQLRTISGDSFIAELSILKMSYKELAQKFAVVLTDKIKGELLTCYDVVATGRYPYTNHLGLLSPRDKKIVLEAMEKVNVLDFAERDFSTISDGQRQRILLARAMCQEPEVIVLDEPTSFLDIKHKLELLNILRKMSKTKGITVIMSLHEIDLAQKISDKIICVNGKYISHFGEPEVIFKEEIIKELYGIKKGSYNIVFGSIELPKPKGDAEVFVIAGAGTGIPLYRKLQKENIAFYTGILFENDVDYQVGKNLAAEVISERPFTEISDDTFNKAVDIMLNCKKVICTKFPISTGNLRMKELVDIAKKNNLICPEL